MFAGVYWVSVRLQILLGCLMVCLQMLLGDYMFCRCYWGGQECSYENFTEVITDYGLCYAFNKDGDLEVASAGKLNWPVQVS